LLQVVAVCLGLAKLLACWHRMAPKFRAAIMRLVRGES
jgi:hypothetical protein